MAWANIRRNKITYLPYMLATAVISGVNLLIAALMTTDKLSNVPAGDSAQMMFSFGMAVFSIFSFFFMVYINNFLIGRRKREFGLYGILGLEKRHVGRILVWENLIVISIGVLAGILLALIFGQLLFLILMKMLHFTPNSIFEITLPAFIVMLAIFAAVFVFTSLLNLVRMHLASPIQLMQAEKKGQKDSVLVWPLAILGFIALGIAYYYAWTISSAGTAIGVFFLLVILVIFATFTLFTSGSVVFLRLLRANKRIYYKSRNFVAIADMFHRMKQNARSLATICILSTMFVVTVSGTLTLYIGREQSARTLYPYDVCVYASIRQVPDADAADQQVRGIILDTAKEYGLTVTADPSKIVSSLSEDNLIRYNNFIPEGTDYIADGTFVITRGEYNTQEDGTGYCYPDEYRFDTDAEVETWIAFCDTVTNRLYELSNTLNEDTGIYHSTSNIYQCKQEGYGAYGGLLFLGVFFGVLFLSVTVLIIYFKQVTEGYEDKARFLILQQIGMDQRQVKDTINRQVLWVFFLPLFTTLLHMLFASRIMNQMLRAFSLNNLGLVLACIGGTSAVFALLYLIVYRLTAHTYYRIVRR